MKELWRRIQWIFHRAEFDRELEDEMRDHLERKAEETGDAQKAHRDFGNITLLKEKSRGMWTWTFMEQLAKDARYAFRTMTANKLFTALAIVSLALGIGANAAIYSFLDAILLRALPVKHPEQLAIFYWRSGTKDEPGVVHDHSGSAHLDDTGVLVSPDYPYRAYEFLRENNQVFSSLFSYANAGQLNLIIDGQAELKEGQYVSGNYFSGLGLAPAAGRFISPEDDNAGAAPIVDISYSFWQRRFGGRLNALDKTILINGKPFTIAGVSPPEFFGLRPQSAPAFFLPVRFAASVVLNPYMDEKKLFASEHAYWIEMAGRLRPGVTLARAQAELSARFQQWVSSTGSTEQERKTLPKLWLQKGRSGMDALRREYSKPLYTLMIMVVLILAIACANLANLLLARGAARRSEMAVRLSLGAGRLRISRQLLTESGLLSLVGGVLGILVAAAGIRSLTLLLANGEPNFTLHAELDWRVLGFTLAVTLAAGFLFGIAPAIQATKLDLTPSLKEARAGSAITKRRRIGAMHVLVIGQIAISLVLVTAAGLFVRTLVNLYSVNVGFNRDKLLVFSLDAWKAGYSDQARINFYAELRRRFALLPGVVNATLSGMPLLADWTSRTDVIIPGAHNSEDKPLSTARIRVGPAFFETLQIPIRAGRAFDERDTAGAPKRAVVNEIFVKDYLAGLSPIGRHFTLGSKETATDLEIIGIAGNSRYSSLKRDISPLVYTSCLQAVQNRTLQEAYFELRTAGNPLALANTVRRVVHDLGPRVPIADITTESKIIDGTIAHERTFADLCGCFGALALLMACVGLYATQAYAVARRTNEIGIRMALGAERGRVLWMVLREVLMLSGIGVLIGLVIVWQTTTVLRSFLFGLKPHDPATLVIAAGILIICAVLAAYAPARRASRIDPMVALRYE
ncbi:MAG: ABC transporter permease [Acidobacteriaceae bacterium]|nr:ABC transporter permease [Acidobacteriaceae bacterium]